MGLMDQMSRPKKRTTIRMRTKNDLTTLTIIAGEEDFLYPCLLRAMYIESQSFNLPLVWGLFITYLLPGVGTWYIDTVTLLIYPTGYAAFNLMETGV